MVLRGTCTHLNGTDWFGGDMLVKKRANTKIPCDSECLANSQCIGYSFNAGYPACYLKATAPNPWIYRGPGFASGVCVPH
jgi:hypothetical protein